MIGEKQWYHSSGRLAPESEQDALRQRKAHFRAIPADQWRTDDVIDSDSVAALTEQGGVFFVWNVIAKGVDRRGLFNFISFTWGEHVIGWLPLGE